MAGLRGVYSIFPSSDPPKPLGPHTDRIAQQLNCATYLMDVPPGGAPFTVWPGVITTALVLALLLSLSCVAESTVLWTILSLAGLRLNTDAALCPGDL